jgi:hypothetical protein
MEGSVAFGPPENDHRLPHFPDAGESPACAPSAL